VQIKGSGLRNLINAILILFASVFAHSLACGTFISIVPFVITSVLLVFAIYILGTREFTNFKLATLLIASQLSSHYLLGTSQMKLAGPNCGEGTTSLILHIGNSMNPIEMFMAHIISFILCFIFVKKNEKFWNFAEKICLRVFSVPKIFTLPVIKFFDNQPTQLFREIVHLINTFLTEASSRISAPPYLLSY
jgi:hypothetical protein